MKNFFVHLGVVVFFIAVAAIFFKPAVFEGKMIVAGDSEKVIRMNKEIRDYQDRTGEGVSWTGSMFSGMPSYTISAPDGPRNYLFDAGLKVFWFLGSTDAGIIFLAMFGMYLFLISMGYGIGISVFGAVAYAFSSYFIIILPAGHVCKAWAMSYLPLVLLGIMLLFKQKWLWGIVVFAASMSLELRSNHIQITYYFAILCVFLFLAFAIGKILNKDYKSLVKTTGFLVLGSFLAIASTADRMYSNYEMSAVSTRGPSRLSAAADGKTDKSTGLDRDYAFAWSYGLGELTTLLVPNSYGGESGGELGADSHISTALRMHNYQVSGPMRMPTYWGAQPFTSGPVYLGAIVCFLAVLSFFISKNKYKWWLVGASVFFIILSLGNNAPIVNNFLFDHLPMYNKFRTPSMALVMPQLTFAILGCMALKTILDGDYDEKKINKYLAISVGIVGGFCLLVWAAPTLFLECSSAADDGYTKQYGDWFTAALIEDRASLASSDAFRSLLYILATAAILWYVIKKENRKYVNVAMGAIAILTLVERSTNMLMMEKLPHGKKAIPVAQTVVRLLMPYRQTIKTITTDNGSEFAAHQLITKGLKMKGKEDVIVYFADSYSSWQKGCIENTNKLIRKYIPKHANFNRFSNETILNIQHKLNKRPREKLNFDTPLFCFSKHFY